MELKINKLTKRFGDITAVNSVSLSMTGGVYGLLGENGAGKTTLMRMLCTLMSPSEGSITLEGRDIFKMDSDYRSLLGYLPQDFGFYPEFTVKDYLMYISSVKGLRPAVAAKRVKGLIHATGLSKVAYRKMKKLSGGMKRRAGIAQAMLNDPKILILDEPTAGLDPNERIRFRNLISEISGNRTVLLSTHIVSDVEYIANEILLMKNGSIIQKGSSEALIASMPQRVWKCSVEKSFVPDLAARYRVSNIRSEKNLARCGFFPRKCLFRELLRQSLFLKMFFSIILVKRLVMKMLLFEIKKILSRPLSRFVLLALAAVLVFCTFMTVNDVRYTDSQGVTHTGPGAARQLHDQMSQWSGYVTSDLLARVVTENNRINSLPRPFPPTLRKTTRPIP